MGLYIHFAIQQLTFGNIIDLRRPEIAEAFVDQTMRLPGFAFKKPLRSFEELLPTILNQELGGGQSFCMVVGLALREAGVHGLIFPSARTDTYVKVDAGRVVDSGGWILVDYRFAGKPDTAVAIDNEPWRNWIGRVMPNESGDSKWIYQGVRINYTNSGPTKGSWKVERSSGLAGGAL